MIEVELTPEVIASLRAMRDRGTPLPRCHKGPIRSAIAGGVRRLVENTLRGGVRPWDLPTLQRKTAALGGRSVLAEEVKNEIFDGATPYSTYVRGVIVDGDRGVVLTGRDDSAVFTEG